MYIEARNLGLSGAPATTPPDHDAGSLQFIKSARPTAVTDAAIKFKDDAAFEKSQPITLVPAVLTNASNNVVIAELPDAMLQPRKTMSLNDEMACPVDANLSVHDSKITHVSMPFELAPVTSLVEEDVDNNEKVQFL